MAMLKMSQSSESGLVLNAIDLKNVHELEFLNISERLFEQAKDPNSSLFDRLQFLCLSNTNFEDTITSPWCLTPTSVSATLQNHATDIDNSVFFQFTEFCLEASYLL